MKLLGHGFNAENIASVVIAYEKIIITYYDGTVFKEGITEEVIIVFDDKKEK